MLTSDWLILILGTAIVLGAAAGFAIHRKSWIEVLIAGGMLVGLAAIVNRLLPPVGAAGLFGLIAFLGVGTLISVWREKQRGGPDP